MANKNYAGTGSYGEYWESWKPALIKGLIAIAVFAIGLVTYGVWLSSLLN